MFLLLLLLCLLPACLLQECNDNCRNLQVEYPDITGDAVLAGLFPVGVSERCDVILPGGEEQLKAAHWTVSRLNQVGFIPGVKLGLKLFPSDGDKNSVIKTTFEAIVTSQLHHNPECRHNYSLGMFSPSDKHGVVSDVGEDWEIPVTVASRPAMREQLLVMSQLLEVLNWSSVVTLGDSTELMDDLAMYAATRNICIRKQMVLREGSALIDLEALLAALHLEGHSHFVLVGDMTLVAEVLTAYSQLNDTKFSWLVTTSSMFDSDIIPDEYGDGTRILFLQPSTSTSGEEHNDTGIFNHPLSLGIMESLYGVALSLRDQMEVHCPGAEGLCPEMGRFHPNLTADTSDITEILGLGPNRIRNYVILRWSRGENGSLEKIGEYQGGEVSLGSGEVRVGGGTHCPGCSCINIDVDRVPELDNIIWKWDTWVTVSVTLSCIGVFCCFIVAVFLCVRLYKDDAVEGHQGMTVMLVIGVVILYAATLPYNVRPTEVVCALRLHGTTLAYSGVFSVLLARSIMLATSDTDGLPGHISGLVQSLLCFFVVGVQVAVTAQSWILGAGEHSFVDAIGNTTCTADKPLVLVSFSYDMFLLLFLFLVTPFVIRSKRNYREGVQFFTATMFIVGVWAAWITLYLRDDGTWKEAIVSGGLVASGAVVITSILVPRTYLVVSSLSRDSLSVLRTSAVPGMPDVPYRSNIGVYDSVNNRMQGAFNNAYTSSVNISGKPESTDNTYEPFHAPPSPSKITHL